MKKAIVTSLITLLLSLNMFSQTATVTLTSEKQLIKGYGGINVPAWGVDLTDAQCETAFGNDANTKLGLSILRIFVDGDKNNWSKELRVAKNAVAHGATVFASPWNPPAAMIETFTRNGVANQKRLKTSSYAAYAQHLNDFVAYMKTNGVNLYAISVQNEPDYASEWTWWTPDEMLNFMKNNAGSITGCKVMSPESFSYLKNMSDPILNDATALANMDILGTHTYGTSFANFSYPLFKSKGAGKELWMTEVYVPNSTANSADNWPEALDVAEHVHNGMVVAEFQAYVWWTIRRSYGPMKEDGNMSKRGCMIAHYSKFVRPGYVRVDATATPTTSVFLSAYKKGNDAVIVAVNKNTTAKTITISIPGTSITSWEKYVTTGSKSMSKETNVSAGTSIQITLDAQSVTTLNGIGSTTTTAPTVVTPVNYCLGSTATALTATGTALKWYSVATGGTALASAPVPSTGTVGSVTYFVSQTVGTSESQRSSITVTTNALPTVSAGTAVSICNGTSTTLTASGASSYKWNNGITTITNSVSPTITTTYSVTGTNATSCSATSSVLVTVNSSPIAPTVLPTVSYSQGASATALTATGSVLKWYNVATGGTALASAPVPATTATGTTNYYVSQTTNNCESPRATIAVVVGGTSIQKVSLVAGWNLIGCPLIGSTDLAKALSSIWSQVETVKNLDAFYSTSNLPAFNLLTKVEWGQGYLVKVKAACILDWIVK